MAWMLARLVRPEGERWILAGRGQEWTDRLPAGAALNPGDLVLLEGEPGAWRAARGPLHASGWPPELPRALDGLEREERSLTPLFSVRGDWMVDPSGQPCEHGVLRTGPDAFTRVLSYAGWRLGDLEGQPTTFERLHTDAGELWVLHPGGSPPPREESELLPRYGEVRFEEDAPSLVPARAPVAEAPPPPEAPAEPPEPAAPPEPAPVRQLGLFGF